MSPFEDLRIESVSLGLIIFRRVLRHPVLYAKNAIRSIFASNYQSFGYSF